MLNENVDKRADSKTVFRTLEKLEEAAETSDECLEMSF